MLEATSQVLPAPRGRQPGIWLLVTSVLLPVLKCAVCPVCLGIFGTALAGARLGFLADERLHGALIGFAILADLVILEVSRRHHRRRLPIVLCAVGGAVALLGHLTEEASWVEYFGFASLMAASIWNVRLLRRHRATGEGCCAHHPSRSRIISLNGELS